MTDLPLEATRRDEPESLRVAVHVRPQRAALHVREPPFGIDLHAAHRREVQQHTTADRRLLRLMGVAGA